MSRKVNALSCTSAANPEWTSINQSPTNRSKSKETFSFGRSSRFRTIEPYCGISTYEKDLFPFSKPSQVQEGYQRTKSSFNRYGLSKRDPNSNQGYTMRQKTKLFDKSKTLEPQNDNPGPGHYLNRNIVNANLPSRGNNSRVRINPQSRVQTQSRHFSNIQHSLPRSSRFVHSYSNTKTPGPGQYQKQQKTSLSPIGKYVVSGQIGGTIAKFGNSKRVSKFDEVRRRAHENPGVGFYRLPSQFGNYDGDVYFQSPSVSSSRVSRRLTRLQKIQKKQ